MIDYEKYYLEASDLCEMQYQAAKEFGWNSKESQELQEAFEQSFFLYRLLKAA